MFLRKSVILSVVIVACLACAYAATDVTGKWTAEFDSQVGLQKYVFELKVEGTKVTGTAISDIGGAQAKTPIQEGKIEGDEISFMEPLNYQGMDLQITYKGKIVSASEIKFSRTVGEAGGEEFVAKKAQ